MKIICIGRNYSEHAKELKNEIPTEPVFFMKPDTALLQNGVPFHLPNFSNDIHHEVELVLLISKKGKDISEELAAGYFQKIGIGIDFTARDLQQKCKEKGLPWEKAKSFDSSAPIGEFQLLSNFDNVNDIEFQLQINGEQRQKGNSKEMIFNFNKIISYVSKFITLNTGDLVFTGTPAGVGQVKQGDKLEAFIEDKLMLSFEVK